MHFIMATVASILTNVILWDVFIEMCVCMYVCMYVYIYIQVHLNKLECRGKVYLFQ